MIDVEHHPGASLWFWKHTAVVGRGHVCYSPGSWWRDGPFTNPARMAEDMGDPFMADVWTYAGWWDQKGRRQE